MASALINWVSNFPAMEVGIALLQTTVSVATFTYNVTANHVVPGVKAVGSTAYHITATYVAPVVITVGSATINTVTRIVKGRPHAISAEAFDLNIEEYIDDDYIRVNNGTELNSLKRSTSVPF